MAARANVERPRTTLEDTRQKYERAKTLVSEQLLPQSDLETAQRQLRRRRGASVEAAQAAVTQAAGQR